MAASIASWLRVVNFDASMPSSSPAVVLTVSREETDVWVALAYRYRVSDAVAAPDGDRGAARGRRGPDGREVGTTGEGLLQAIRRGISSSSSATRTRSAATWFSSSRIRRTPSSPMPAGGELGDLAQQLDVALASSGDRRRRCGRAMTRPIRS